MGVPIFRYIYNTVVGTRTAVEACTVERNLESRLQLLVQCTHVIGPTRVMCTELFEYKAQLVQLHSCYNSYCSSPRTLGSVGRISSSPRQ